MKLEDCGKPLIKGFPKAVQSSVVPWYYLPSAHVAMIHHRSESMTGLEKVFVSGKFEMASLLTTDPADGTDSEKTLKC